MNNRNLRNAIFVLVAAAFAAGPMIGAAEAGKKKRGLKKLAAEQTLKKKRKRGAVLKGNSNGAGKPDLVVQARFNGNNGLPNTGYCGAWNGGNQSVVWRLKNVGSVPSPASQVWVSFDPQDFNMLMKVNAPALAPGQTANMHVNIPAGAWSNNAHPSVNFSWHADGQWIIDEASEANNGGSSNCIGPAT